MTNLGIILALILVSAVPAVAVFAWFRLARYPFSPLAFLLSLFAGATSVFAALFMQHFLAVAGIFPPLTNRTSLLVEIFVRIAFTEEFSRVLLLAPLFLLFRRIGNWKNPAEAAGVSDDTRGKVFGLVAGIGFGIFESAVFGTYYGAAYPFLHVLLRAFTATPLHAACASRVGSSVAGFRKRPALAVFQFLSAVAIHGLYNLLIVTPGRIMPWVAVFVAFSALFSSIQAIVRGMRAEDGE